MSDRPRLAARPRVMPDPRIDADDGQHGENAADDQRVGRCVARLIDFEYRFFHFRESLFPRGATLNHIRDRLVKRFAYACNDRVAEPITVVMTIIVSECS